MTICDVLVVYAFGCSGTLIWSSNPTRGMDVFHHLSMLFCNGRGLAVIWSPTQGVLLLILIKV